MIEFLKTILTDSLLWVFVWMTFFYLISLFLKNNGIADIAWGLGFAGIAFIALILSGKWGKNPLKLLLFLMIFLWALRLSVYLFIRNYNKEEDYRYQQFRKDWGKQWIWKSYLQVYMLQGVLMLFIALPIYITALLPASHQKISAFQIIASGIWTLGWLIESIADIHLYLFKRQSQNKGKLLTTGLWKISRHPNYLGESLVWIGMAFYTLNFPYGYVSLLSPVLVVWLLYKVSGVPLLEKKLKQRPDFEDYKKKVSSIFPGLK